MLSRSVIKRFTAEEKTFVKEGALFATIITGGVAYWNYRQYLKKSFYRSEGHYRLNRYMQNATPWTQLYWTWWRMPDEMYDVYHRFTPYFVTGQLDYSKEILIPRKKTLACGATVDGYDVLNPLYCYEGGRTSFKKAFNKEDPISIERAAIVVNRGWIPAELKDRRSRPHESDNRMLKKYHGVWRRGKDIHDYKIPNNPDNNEWHNLSLEDIGIFWDLPNYDEQKYYYFQLMPVGNQEDDYRKKEQYPIMMSKDELIEDHYKWRFNETTNKLVFSGLGLASLASLAVTFLA